MTAGNLDPGSAPQNQVDGGPDLLCLGFGPDGAVLSPAIGGETLSSRAARERVCFIRTKINSCRRCWLYPSSLRECTLMNKVEMIIKMIRPSLETCSIGFSMCNDVNMN